MTTGSQEQSRTSVPTAKMLLWLAIASMIMLFAGLTSAYIVRQSEGNWTRFNLPSLFTVSTVIIITSSLSVQRAVVNARRNNKAYVQRALVLTLVLGAMFVICQFFGWEELYAQKIVFAGRYANPAGSFLYVLTGLHLLHLFGGILYLAFVLIKTTREPEMKSPLKVELFATYWHFVDVLWVYLYLFLLFVK